MEFEYNTPVRGFKIRNKTDNTTWSSVGWVTMTTANQGHIAGTIWHSANDGTGTGLDADLWDGYQFSDYLNQPVRTTDNVTHNRLTLGVATGTSPLVVSSTTLVSSLNSDLLDGQEGTYYDQRQYTRADNYLGGYYVSGGSEKPNNAIFGAGKFKVAMLSSGNLGFSGPWSDVLWTSTYSGGDVKSSFAIVSDKYSENVFFAKQAFQFSICILYESVCSYNRFSYF
jgi:hypothetical protein